MISRKKWYGAAYGLSKKIEMSETFFDFCVNINREKFPQERGQRKEWMK